MHLNGTVQVTISEELRRELREAALEITDYAADLVVEGVESLEPGCLS
jgi:hypothetical protein